MWIELERFDNGVKEIVNFERVRKYRPEIMETPDGDIETITVYFAGQQTPTKYICDLNVLNLRLIDIRSKR